MDLPRLLWFRANPGCPIQNRGVCLESQEGKSMRRLASDKVLVARAGIEAWLANQMRIEASATEDPLDT